ncbi:MAG: LamB/YcsF family protein [Bacteroidetes bacterium]|nr:LamB/YcsF family protein [Bacteroidota bacterium]
MLRVDLNCDMGESSPLWSYHIEKDLELLQYVSSVNLACGYHAGDPETMKTISDACIKSNIAIGAHPSFPDLKNFGRTEMHFKPGQITEMVMAQINVLNTIVQSMGVKLHHVKPHGALYNMAAKDDTMAKAICKAIVDLDPSIIIYGLSGSALISAGAAMGLETCSEAFADRTYQDDGSLTHRTSSQALISDTSVAASQVLRMIQKANVVSVSGKEIPILAETICIHGDGPNAIGFSKEINQLLIQNGIGIKAKKVEIV